MAEAGITFRKEYGQNFLISPDVPERIADECADTADTVVLEIGPGIGCLTAELAARYRHVVAVEIDAGLIPILSKTLAEFDNVTVINADCMKLDLAGAIREALGVDSLDGIPLAVCANLPYYITTPILMHLLESRLPLSSITVMIQKEVADRLVSPPGKSDYGAITAVLGYYGDVRRLFTVPPGCFLPAPKVSSSVVRIDLPPKDPISVCDETLLMRLIHAAFEQRRKTLVNAITAKFSSLTKDKLSEILVSLGFDVNIRGERLSTADFAKLADRIAAL
jgi:16S rRNA (adenine1518-N6/adenine1519-N6)-dimethyltransferase